MEYSDNQVVLNLGQQSNDTAAVLGHAICTTLFDGYQGRVAVRLWDGYTAGCHHHPICTVIFRQPGALRHLIVHRNLLHLVEAYLAGAVDVAGDMEALFSDLVPYLDQRKLTWPTCLGLVIKAIGLPASLQNNSTPSGRAARAAHINSRASIAHHYDVNNDFYRLWLDPEMVYSCAYFRNDSQPLAEAQHDKLDYICRKLRLAPGQHLLDIGCGWGALVLWAARHYGVRAHGITLSEAQHRYARERIAAAGLQDQVKVELRDYRNLPAGAQYDRVVSVGMFEHVGVKNFPTYFGVVRQALKPGGLFLNHGITSKTRWRRTPLTRFMNRYIFPDGELARISDVTDAMEQAGFEVLDTESLRRHYALTLHHWVRALEAKREAATAASSEVTWRLWRLYMAGCAHYFNEGSIGVHQVLAGHLHSSLPVPLRRDDLYTEDRPDSVRTPAGKG